jgi:hypothetical protein
VAALQDLTYDSVPTLINSDLEAQEPKPAHIDTFLSDFIKKKPALEQDEGVIFENGSSNTEIKKREGSVKGIKMKKALNKLRLTTVRPNK